MLGWLLRQFARLSRRVMPTIVVYSRRDCHLCEVAWDQLVQARQQHGFTLEKIDVDSHPELVQQYGECVPVVLVDGKVRFRGQVNLVLLRRLLRSCEAGAKLPSDYPASE